MFQVFSQLNTILKKEQKRKIIFLMLGAFFVALLDTVVVALMSPFMALLTNLGGFSESAFGRFMSVLFGVRSTNQYLAILAAGFVVLYIFRGAAKIAYNFWQARLLAVCRTDLSTRLFAYVMHKPYSYHLMHNTAETQRLVSSDVYNCFTLINSLLLTASSGLVSLGIFIVLLTMNWQLTLALCAVILLLLFWAKKRLKVIIKKYAEMNYSANAEMNKWVSQAVGGLKNIIVKRKQNFYVSQYKSAAVDAAVANSNYLAVDSLPKVLIDTMCMVLVFTTVLLELLLNDDVLSALPMFATFAIAALRLIPVAGQVTSTINFASFYRPSLDIICDIIQSGEVNDTLEKELENQEDKNPDVDSHCEVKHGIELSHIGFKYENTEHPLYTDLNLFIPAKKSVAFVGTTGSGKTTLADIILGLHKPTNGAVLADGIDISENPKWWSSMLGYIPQFIYLCDDTIRSNVAFGVPSDEIDDDWVWECLGRAQMKEYVQSLPNGLDTITGENGIRLSGGQRQRIGIARALYFKPQFLLMDEATSSLDGDTEKAIVDSINMLSGDITLLIIAHRLSTIENCDIIYRIENGKATTDYLSCHSFSNTVGDSYEF